MWVAEFEKLGNEWERVMKNEHYSVVIQWSAEDSAYVVTLPEWGGCHTHGATYEEAARNAQEVLAILVEGEEEAGRPLPQPHKFIYPGPSGFTYQFPALSPAVTGAAMKKVQKNGAGRMKAFRRTPA